MANITLSAEELVKLMTGEDVEELKAVKARMQKLLIDAWLGEDSFRAELQLKANELAEKTVERRIEQAFTDTTVGWGSNKHRDFIGWAAEIVKDRLNKELEQHKHHGHSLSNMVYMVTKEEVAKQQAEWTKTLADLQSIVDTEVRKSIPHYVTDTYKERVADKLHDKEVERLLTEMVQRTVGAMLISGALTFNPAKAEPNN